MRLISFNLAVCVTVPWSVETIFSASSAGSVCFLRLLIIRSIIRHRTAVSRTIFAASSSAMCRMRPLKARLGELHSCNRFLYESLDISNFTSSRFLSSVPVWVTLEADCDGTVSCGLTKNASCKTTASLGLRSGFAIRVTLRMACAVLKLPPLSPSPCEARQAFQ